MSVRRFGFPYLPANFRASAPQKRFLSGTRKKLLLNCGRFSGKTMLALIKLLAVAAWLYAIRRRDRNWWRPGPLVTVGIFAPTESNYEPLWDMLCSLVPNLPGKAHDGLDNTTILRGERMICIFGFLGIQIKLISCWAPDNIRGAGFDIAFIDETAQLKRPNIYFQAILPLVSRASYYGMIILASTPLNNFWDRWAVSARQEAGRFGHFEYHNWTGYENPKLTDEQRDEMQRAREDNYAAYAQEYLAKLFVQLPAEETLKGEAIWHQSQLEELFVSDLQPLGVQKIVGPFAVGLDLAWSGADEAVLTVIDKPTNLVCHIEIFEKTTDPELLEIMARATRQWGNPMIYYDRSGGRAKAFHDHIPPHIKVHPLVIRRSIDRNQKTEFVVSKDLLARGVEQRMTLGKLKLPHPEEFDFSTLPWSTEQNQQANFRQLRDQMLAMRRITVRKASGDEEYLYRAEPTAHRRTRKFRRADDCFDSLLVAARGLPAIQEPHISLDEFKAAVEAAW